MMEYGLTEERIDELMEGCFAHPRSNECSSSSIVAALKQAAREAYIAGLNEREPNHAENIHRN